MKKKQEVYEKFVLKYLSEHKGGCQYDMLEHMKICLGVSIRDLDNKKIEIGKTIDRLVEQGKIAREGDSNPFSKLSLA